MTKQLGVYFLFFALISLVGYNLHTVGLSEIASKSPFSLKDIYMFYGSFSLLLCTIFLLLSQTQKFKDQLGFLYLVSVALKIVLFCIVFYKYIFTQDSFTNQETFNLLIPMVLMLIPEVFFITKILNNLSVSKNAE